MQGSTSIDLRYSNSHSVTDSCTMTDNHDDDELGAGNLFADPEGFYPEDEQPTFSSYQMLSGQTIHVRLVGSHPLYVCDFFLSSKHPN